MNSVDPKADLTVEVLRARLGDRYTVVCGDGALGDQWRDDAAGVG